MGKSKLTEGEVEQIREQYKSGRRPKLIARKALKGVGLWPLWSENEKLERLTGRIL